MERNTPNITIHMVASLDGYVAKPDGSVDWMHTNSHYEHGKVLTEAAIAEFLASIDCYVLGARSYEHALKLGWPYGETPMMVLTHRDLPQQHSAVEFFAGEPSALVREHLAPRYNNVWVGGGPDVARQFLQEGLATELVISLLPVVLGDGLPFFGGLEREVALQLLETTAYSDGMVELRYGV